MKIKEGSVVATHSCCYSLCQHPRNLKDEQIKQIAKNDGMIGICYCTNYRENRKFNTRIKKDRVS